MAGPAMIEGGGLGRVHPDEVGPVAVQAANGVIDVVVPDEAAAVDHEQARADFLDVAQVVRREHDRDAQLAVGRAQEGAEAVLDQHVQADRRLVEEQHLRLVQERQRDLAAHPLPERKLAHGEALELADAQQVLAEREPAAEALRRDAVDVAVQVERLLQRQVPP